MNTENKSTDRFFEKTFLSASLRNESGAALVMSLLFMVIMLSLVPVAMQMTTREFDQAEKFKGSRELFYLAEAGLEHAKMLTETSNMNAILAGPDNDETDASDNGTFGAGSLSTLSDGNIYDAVAFNGNTYFIRAYDNDDGDGDFSLDSDSMMILTAIGQMDGKTTTLEATVYNPPSGTPENAVVINGDMMVSGNPTVSGACGSLHANGDMDVSGDPDVDENVTATGSFTAGGNPTIGGVSGGGYSEIPVPDLQPSDYEQYADYVLAADGNVYDSNGDFVHDGKTSLWNGWDYSSPKWTMSKNATIDASLYVEGDAVISGNPGNDGNPWELTVVATGFIEVSGTPDIANKMNPSDPEEIQNLFMMAGTDLKFNGNVDQYIEGLFYAREQFNISGNPDINGSVMALDLPSVEGLVSENNVSGNATITYGCDMVIPGDGNQGLKVLAWHQVD